MMKLTYFKTHWSAADAILVKEFLEDLAAGIAATYAEDIAKLHEDMTAECIRCLGSIRHHNPTKDDEIPF